ncbi:MAG TPA: hypothetical protein VKA95_01715 [Nitrososphaeraceae archaeon]|nr:hypothetical protein [Nitrososphaeraceae archaeon]
MTLIPEFFHIELCIIPTSVDSREFMVAIPQRLTILFGGVIYP